MFDYHFMLLLNRKESKVKRPSIASILAKTLLRSRVQGVIFFTDFEVSSSRNPFQANLAMP